MKRLTVRIIIAVLGFAAVNGILMGLAAAKGAGGFFATAAGETVLFVLLQLYMTVNLLICPPDDKKQRTALLIVSELLVGITVFFWGFFIVGPIWLTFV